MESLENLENHYDDFSAYRQAEKICKIALQSPFYGGLGYLSSKTFWNWIEQCF